MAVVVSNVIVEGVEMEKERKELDKSYLRRIAMFFEKVYWGQDGLDCSLEELENMKEISKDYLSDTEKTYF